jgi:ABC-2 family transporter protein
VDKETKMRETLKILSMRPSVYGLSYFIIQSLFSILTAFLITFTLTLLGFFSPSQGLVFFIAVTFYGLAMIFKSMAISTLFSDSKVAGQLGSLILIAPMALFMYLFSQCLWHQNIKIMYWGYMVPYVPLVIVIGNTLMVDEYEYKLLEGLNMPLTWACLILSLPLYYFLYVYLDSIIPDTYGISKSCCFCLKRRRRNIDEESR